MSWQRPNIGSRVTREGHARFWERLGVQVPWATRRPLFGVLKGYVHVMPGTDLTKPADSAWGNGDREA